jgi:Flp pilus assembly protein TadG
VVAALQQHAASDDHKVMQCAVRRPGRNERGALLVEFALVLPLLLSLFLGIFTGGVAYSNKIGLVEAVREGARFGASLPMGSGAGAVDAWETQVKNRVVAASGGDVALADICVKFVLPIGGTDCGLADPSGASNEPTVHLVKVSATRSATLEFFFFKSDKVMQGKLVARFERDTG